MAAAALAIGGAMATRDSGGLATGVEGASASASSWLEGAAATLPLGYAVGAGTVSAVNRCGFALLPAYVGYYLRSQEARAAAPGTASLVAHALWISAVMTAGFLLLFGTAGVALGAASSLLVRFLPWLGFAVGVALLVIRARLLHGGTVYVGFGESNCVACQDLTGVGLHSVSVMKMALRMWLSFRAQAMMATLVGL